jgi:peptidoglycan/LPS O-acetylase OafA/YrhL
VAVVLVVAFHAGVGAAGGGFIGVDVFFVLSGFLITGILADARHRPRGMRTFYARRALRILPLYFGFLALVFGLPLLLGTPEYATPFREQLRYFFSLQNLWGPVGRGTSTFAPHLWSLAIEEQFYLVWPLVVTLLPREKALWASLACVVGAFAFRVACLLHGADLRTLYFSTPARLDGLAVGATIALIARGPGGLARLRRWAPWTLAAGAVAFAGASRHPSGFRPDGLYMLVIGFSALALAFGSVLVLALDAAPARIPALLSWAPLRFFGQYSYALYVLHYALQSLARLAGVTPASLGRAGGGDLAGVAEFVLGMTAATLLCALLSWHLYEKQFLKLKPRFATQAPEPAS